jgi:ABC-type transport system involved in multi-copper enzyme maturation permease subunit
MSARVVRPGQGALAAVVVRHALQEAVRRKVLLVVAALTAAFLVLYAIGCHFAFDESTGFNAGPVTVRDRALTGATVLGLAMFATLFLGAVLATFLTLGVVRGDAETGMLQPLVARPPSRATILLARIAGAAAVSAAYVVLVYAVTVLITALIGDWSPDRPFAAGALLAGGVIVIAFISLLASVWLSSTAQGIAVLMVYGGGLTAGLLGQIGDSLNAETLVSISNAISWALPFEAVYQNAIHALTADTGGFAGLVINLGPFGGARNGGAGLIVWSVAYLVLVAALAVWGFRRRDL